ncbi:MAG: glycerophosphoryl diester phosphodiesterase [Acidobacteriales bacterium]|nr:glycerophosphoryl diester phosphodiesterase [Terriglobales bacterium]
MSSERLPTTRQSPLFLGHRGTRVYAPENTFAAFDIALEHGCDGFEFDVRRTCDNVAAICHDAHFHKLKVEENTLAELRAVHPLATLEELLREYGARCYLNIELKDAGLEEETVRLLKKYPVSGGVLVSSFLPEVIECMAELSGGMDLSLGYICRNLRLLSKWKKLPISHAIINHKIYSKSLHKELRAAGIATFVWTINDAAEAEKFRDLGVDGIISDDTKLSRYARVAKAQAVPISE